MMYKYWSCCVYAVLYSVDDIFGSLTWLSDVIDVSFISSFTVGLSRGIDYELSILLFIPILVNPSLIITSRHSSQAARE